MAHNRALRFLIPRYSLGIVSWATSGHQFPHAPAHSLASRTPEALHGHSAATGFHPPVPGEGAIGLLLVGRRTARDPRTKPLREEWIQLVLRTSVSGPTGSLRFVKLPPARPSAGANRNPPHAKRLTEIGMPRGKRITPAAGWRGKGRSRPGSSSTLLQPYRIMPSRRSYERRHLIWGLL
ncbi:hypothetical protein BU26DRAFT_507634 [Trematosphaeria pertusa]|uniref:Uncharacterized protein n=1 Tax=Trematosphaeria pertusa TaxID=390896 RepID=A0A6A6I8X8_9PLEO|nr:uncharacterized protein BU26DRAFT_507634 [Trematosphaeria pertusa]KAF2245973.1 hypothetical protein BU26DRAFT_507634 [Trematosphaeria pertusa]